MIKAPLSIRNILLLTIGTLSFLIAIFTLQQVYHEWQRMEKFRSVKDATLLGDSLFDAIEMLTVERDAAFFMLHAPDPEMAESLARDLVETRGGVDKPLEDGLTAFGLREEGGFAARAEDGLKYLRAIQSLRKEVDAAAKLVASERDPHLAAKWFESATALIALSRGLWMDFMARFYDVDSRVALHSRFKFSLGLITEDAGRQRALIGRFLAQNSVPTPEEQSQLLRAQGRLEQSWLICASLAAQGSLLPAVAPALKDAQSHYSNLHDMMRELFYVPGVSATLPYPISADLWLELATEATDSLYALKDAALQASRSYIGGQQSKALDSIVIQLGVLLASLALCVFSFRVVTRRVLRPIHEIAEALLRTSQGEETQPIVITSERQDEIGKLAKVLRSFQATMQDMKRYTRDLERSNKELDDFAYIASHDLKEPLRGISNHARFLLDDNEGKLDQGSVSRITRLIFLSQRVEKLVNDLLYFSRLGRQELAMLPTDIGAMVRDVENTMAEFLKARNAKITVPRPLPTVTCDEVRVMEVFRNLVVNAVKYNDSPEKIVEIGYYDVHAGPEGTPARDVFYVKDNGHGINPDFHQDIFRIFRRIEKPLQNQEEGTGAGLTFVKKIIEKHGGNIWVESDIGKGATFYFTLNEGASKHDRRTAA
jgi:signal transduction histidine kinase